MLKGKLNQERCMGNADIWDSPEADGICRTHAKEAPRGDGKEIGFPPLGFEQPLKVGTRIFLLDKQP